MTSEYENNKLPEQVDSKTGTVVRAYTTTVFGRADMLQDGSNNDLLCNWSPSPEAACSAAWVSSIAKQFIIRRQNIGPCQYGHDIVMIEKY
ncbi:hypothetical protein ABWH74_003065 [Burkholderia vietnamiensis]